MPPILRAAQLRLPERLHLPVLMKLGRLLPVKLRLLLLLHVLRRVLAPKLLLLVVLLRGLPEGRLLELLHLRRPLLLVLHASGLTTERLEAPATNPWDTGLAAGRRTPRGPLGRRVIGLRRQVDRAGRRDGQLPLRRLRAADALLAACRAPGLLSAKSGVG